VPFDKQLGALLLAIMSLSLPDLESGFFMRKYKDLNVLI
jgi:hypothetical protein